MPFAAFAHNQAWLELSLVAQDLLRWAARSAWRASSRLAEPKRRAPAPAARRRAPRALGPADEPAAAALLAVGRGSGRGLRAVAGAACDGGAIGTLPCRRSPASPLPPQGDFSQR